MNPDDKTLVAIESPYAGDVERNEAFARRVAYFATRAGYSPYAMHLFFTQFLDDDAPDERRLGIECGLAWTDRAEEIWVCTRPGEEPTRGMLIAEERNREQVADGRDLRLRELTFSQEGRLLDGWEGPLPDVDPSLLGPLYRARSPRTADDGGRSASCRVPG